MRIFYIIICILFIAGQAQAKILFNKSLNHGKTKLQVSKNDWNKYTLKYNGSIPDIFESWDYYLSLKKALNTIPDNTDFTITLNSPGGSTTTAEGIEALLERKCPSRKFLYNWQNKKKCQITTRVENDGLCASACVLFYMLGRKREASIDARFGFHTLFVKDNNGITIYPEKMLEYLSYFKVNPQWLHERYEEGVFHSTQMSFYTPDMLTGSNVVQKIL